MAYVYTLIPNDTSLPLSSGMNDGELVFQQSDYSFYTNYKGILYSGRFTYTPSSINSSSGIFVSPNDFNTLQNFYIASGSGISINYSLESINDVLPADVSDGEHNLFFISSGVDIEYNYKTLLDVTSRAFTSFPLLFSSHTVTSNPQVELSYEIIDDNISIVSSGVHTLQWSLSDELGNVVYSASGKSVSFMGSLQNYILDITDDVSNLTRISVPSFDISTTVVGSSFSFEASGSGIFYGSSFSEFSGSSSHSELSSSLVKQFSSYMYSFSFPNLPEKSYSYDITGVIDGNYITALNNTFVSDITEPDIEYSFNISGSGITILASGSGDDVANTFHWVLSSGGTVLYSSGSSNIDVSFANLQDRTYNWNLEATDSNSNTHSVPIDFTIDTIPPIISVTKPNQFPTGNRISILASGTSTDTSNTFNFLISSGVDETVVMSSSNVTHIEYHATLTDDFYPWTLKVTDPLNNTVFTETIHFTIDNIPPDIEYSFNISGSGITILALGSGNDVANTFHWVLSSGGTVLYSSGSSNIDVSFANLQDRTYNWNLEATDSNSNTHSVPIDFTIDTIPPVFTYNASVAGSGITITASGSGLDRDKSFEWIISSGSGTESVYTATSTNISQTFYLEEGSYTWNLLVQEKFNSSSVDIPFLIDTTPPEISVSFEISNSGSGTDLLITASGSGIDVGKEFEWTVLDGANVIDQEKTDEFSYNATGLSSGDYSWKLKATDTNQNTTEKDIVFRIDFTPPIIDFTPPIISNNSSGSGITISASGSGDDLHRTFFWTLYDNGVELKSSSGTEFSYTGTSLVEDDYVYTLQVVDLNNNSSSIPIPFRIDFTPPNVYIFHEVLGSGFTIISSGISTDEGRNFYWSLTDQSSNLITPTYANSVNETIQLVDGTYNALLEVTDDNNNTFSSGITFVIDTTAPTITEPVVTRDGYDVRITSTALEDADWILTDTDTGTELGSSSGSSFVYMSSDLYQKTYNYALRAKDWRDNAVDKDITFTIDGIPATATYSNFNGICCFLRRQSTNYKLHIIYSYEGKDVIYSLESSFIALQNNDIIQLFISYTDTTKTFFGIVRNGALITYSLTRTEGTFQPITFQSTHYIEVLKPGLLHKNRMFDISLNHLEIFD